MTRYLLVFTLVSTLLWNSTGMAQKSTAQNDQSVVQQAYAKAAYALQLTAVFDLYPGVKDYVAGKQITPAEVQAAVDASTVTFQISNIKTGLIGEIADKGTLEMIGSPLHSRLRITANSLDYSKNCGAADQAAGRTCLKGSQVLATAWVQPSPAEPTGPMTDMPLSEALKIGRYPDDYTRYVTYTVRRQYQSQEVTYNALALFGGNGRPSILDGYTDVDGFITTEVYPSAMLAGMKESRSVPQPAITDWIRNMPTDSTCQSGKTCCNPDTMKCAISPSDLQPYQTTHPLSELKQPCLGYTQSPHEITR